MKGVALTAAIMWGVAVMGVGLMNLKWPSYGNVMLALVDSIYPGYHAGAGLKSVVIGTLYAVLDGAVCGAVFAWIYNKVK